MCARIQVGWRFADGKIRMLCFYGFLLLREQEARLSLLQDSIGDTTGRRVKGIVILNWKRELVSKIQNY